MSDLFLMIKSMATEDFSFKQNLTTMIAKIQIKLTALVLPKQVKIILFPELVNLLWQNLLIKCATIKESLWRTWQKVEGLR